MDKASQTLGVRFLDKQGKDISFRKKQGYSGGSLKFLNHINTKNINKKIKKTTIFVACDVTNPLHGKNGTAYIYSPQKGATKQQVKLLDSYLKKFEKVVKKDLKKEINIPGSGAADGLGAGLIAFLDAKLE